MASENVKSPKRLFPAIMVVAGLAFVAKTGLLFDEINMLSEPAEAQQSEEPEGEAPADDTGADSAEQNTIQPQDGPPPGIPGAVSRSELQLLEELSGRRESLEKREAEIELREQLLAATEQRLDGKISELRDIEERIQALIVQYEEQENAQLANIVKVYETMKPKDAAPIFQGLDMDIQIDVAQRMKSQKMAAVLAEMDAAKARALTSELATRSQLPIEQALVGN